MLKRTAAVRADGCKPFYFELIPQTDPGFARRLPQEGENAMGPRIVGSIILVLFVFMLGCAVQQQQPYSIAPQPPSQAVAAAAPPAPPQAPAPAPDPWPRKFSFVDANGVSTTLLVYQPQVESWEGNRITFRAAVGAVAGESTRETFGVVWAAARTEVNRAARMLTLADLSLTRSNFPSMADNGAAYLQQLQMMSSGDACSIALDRLQASLAASGLKMPPEPRGRPTEPGQLAKPVELGDQNIRQAGAAAALAVIHREEGERVAAMASEKSKVK
jgi:hypothetical protein